MPGRPTKTEDIDDIEIVADILRLTRAAPPGAKAEAIFSSIREMHPEVEEARIRSACKVAADLLLAQHS